MTDFGLLIDYKWCYGCHTCEVACQQAHEGYAPTELGEQGRFGIKITQIGPIELDDGKFQYEFLPIPTSLCDLCVKRTEKGKLPTCVKHCQAGCMKYGPIEELSKMLDSDHMVLFR